MQIRKKVQEENSCYVNEVTNIMLMKLQIVNEVTNS